MRFLEFIASVLTLVSLYALSENMLIYGFSLGIIANVLWLWWGHEKTANSLMLLNASMIFINLNGLQML